MKAIRLLLLGLLICLIPVMLLSGCDDDDDDDEASIRVLHMSYDAPAVNVLVNNDIITTNLNYPESSGYAEVDDGTRIVQIVPTGDPSTVVLQNPFDLEEDKSYTLVVVDQLALIDTLFALDARERAENAAKVRFIHASPDAPAIDIKTDSGSGTPVFEGVMFKDITPYIQVPPGNYVFAITESGSTEAALQFNPITLENGEVYTFVAHGTVNETDDVPISVRVFNDREDGSAFVDLVDANIMVINASPNAPGVDVLVDDKPAITNLLFPNNSEYIGALSGTRNIKVNPTGTATPVIDQDLNFETGSSYQSFFAFNNVEAIQSLVLEDDLTPPAAGTAHLRFVHLSPDAPPVDVAIQGGPVIFDNVAFGESDNNGEFTPVPAGAYNLEVRLAGTNTVVLPLPEITLEDGKIYTAFANGYVTPPAGAQGLNAAIIVNK